MSERLESSAREFDLEKQLHLLRQDRELAIMELAQFKDREVQLKRLNETLMKALTEEKPSSALLHEIKLIIEQCGGSEKEKALEAQIDRMRKQKEREIEDRVQAIVKDGKLGNLQGKCKKCQEYLDRISQLESEVKRTSIIIINLTDEKSRLNEELSRATSDISTLQIKKSDLENELRRIRETYESELTKQKQFRRKQQAFHQTEAANKLEAQWRDKLEKAQLSNRQQIEKIRNELEENFQVMFSNKVNELENYYGDLFQNTITEMQQNHRLEVEKARMEATAAASRRNEFEENSKRVSRVTPTKYRGPTENNGVIGNCQPLRFLADQNEGTEEYRMARQAKSRTVYFHNDPEEHKQGQIKDQIKNIISGLAISKQNTSHLPYSGMNGPNLGGYGSSGATAEYSNFSIKDSLNRPNTILESHLRLKRRE